MLKPKVQLDDQYDAVRLVDYIPKIILIVQYFMKHSLVCYEVQYFRGESINSLPVIFLIHYPFWRKNTHPHAYIM